jgi:hypothetical protein
LGAELSNEFWDWDDDFEWHDSPVEDVVQESEEYITAEDERSKSKRSLVTPAILLGTATLALCGAVEFAKKFEHSNIPSKCSQVPVAEERRVRLELGRPLDVARRVIFSEKGLRLSEDYRSYIDTEAKNRGFHLVDDLPYQKEMARANSVDEVLDILNQFSGKYGFSVELHDRDNPSAISKGPMDQQGLFKYFRFGAVNMMEYFHFLPVEVANLADIKKLVIRRGGIPKGYSATAKPDGTITIKFHEFVGAKYTIFMHEIGHEVDDHTCGDQANIDPTYTNLNPSGFTYQRGSRHWQGITATKYGARKPVEDKAEMYKDMLSMIVPERFNDSDKAIREKYLLLLERLDLKIPGIADYYAVISGRLRNNKISDDIVSTWATYGVPKIIIPQLRISSEG